MHQNIFLLCAISLCKIVELVQYASANTPHSIKRFIVDTDKQNALRRECTFKIEIVLEIGVAGVNIYLKITVLTLSDV